MAKRTQIPGFYIPYDEVPAILGDRKKARMYHAWRVIKCECGPSFTMIPEVLDPRHVAELVTEGWLRQDKKTKRYYQVKSSRTFEFTEGRDEVFMPRRWNQKDKDAVLFHATNAHFTRIHPAAASKLPEAVIEWRERASLPTLNPRCEHLGGMAHSRVEKETGISYGKSHYLRIRCAEEGLSFFTSRYRTTRYDTDLEANVYGHKGHVFNAKWGTLERLTSKFHCIEEVQFRRITHRKPGKHRVVGSCGSKGSIENYTTGNTLAQYG